MKTLLVGQAPSRTSVEPFDGRSGARLASLCGMTHLAFLDHFDRINLIKAYPGKAGAGDAFPMPEARAAAAAISEVISGRRVILLGSEVGLAFRLRALLFQETLVGTNIFVIAPHPSGLSRWWNEAPNWEAARVFWRAEAARS